MTKTKSTKKALIFSVLSLVLCLTMLVGTTFAWFTDSVTSGKNVIVSGNLDVELEYLKDGKWVTVEGATDLVNPDALWEPGHVEVVYFKVSNLGTLALKYQFGMQIAAETTGINVANEVFKLSDHIKFGLLTSDDEIAQFATREEAVAAVIDPVVLNEGFTVPSDMAAGEDQYAALVVYMPTTVGNEANYKTGTVAPKIELGVSLVATQVEAEMDGFGDDYDKEAIYYDVLVTNEAELVAALENADANVIAIKGTVPFTAANAGKSTDMGNVTLVGFDSKATLEVRGNGGGLSNVNMQNLTVVDSTFYTSQNGENAWEFTYLELEGTNTFVNVAFEDGVLFEGNNTCVDCTFSGHNNDSSEHGNVTMYGAWVYDGVATFTGCLFSGTRGLKVADYYSGSDVTNVVVDDCIFGSLSEKPGLAVDNRLGALNLVIKNSVFAGTQPGDGASNSENGVPYIYENDNRTPDVTTITLENSTVAEYAASTADLKAAAKEAGATVVVAPGVYTEFPSFAEGVTLVGTEDVVFNATLKGTLNNTTIKNVHIKNGNAQRWAYSRGTLVFEDCTFEATSVYAIHYDGLNGANITYKNCKIIGWVAIGRGAEHITFDGCEIYGNGYYGVIRLYSPGTIKNCTFDVSAVNTTDVYQDGIHAVDCTITVENVTNVNGAVEDLFNISGTGKIEIQ